MLIFTMYHLLTIYTPILTNCTICNTHVLLTICLNYTHPIQITWYSSAKPYWLPVCFMFLPDYANRWYCSTWVGHSGFLFEVAHSTWSNLKTLLPWSQQHWRHHDKFPDQSFQRSDPNQISALQGHPLPGCCAGSTKPRCLPTHTQRINGQMCVECNYSGKLLLHIIA